MTAAVISPAVCPASSPTSPPIAAPKISATPSATQPRRRELAPDLRLGVGEELAGRDVEDLDLALLATAEREHVAHVLAVRRDRVGVERRVLLGRAELLGIDQDPLGIAVARRELRELCVRGERHVDLAAARDLDAVHRGDTQTELADPRQQLVALG